VVITHPDGIGVADQSYPVDGVLAGVPPLTVDFEMGPNSYPGLLQPTTPVEKGAHPTFDPDGHFHYAWNTSAVALDNVFLRARVTDGMGRSVYSDSAGLAIAHVDGGAGDAAARRDPLPPPKSGCALAPERARMERLGLVGGALVWALACALTARALRRRDPDGR
jgi:hypothetical protein